MIGPLLVLVAHALDALTLLIALEYFPFEGNEWGLGAGVAYAMAGVGGILILKLAGATVAAAIVALARKARTAKLLFASAAGIVGASVNLIALAYR